MVGTWWAWPALISGGLISVALGHLAFCWIAGFGSELERSENCSNCCFREGKKCRNILWNWFPVGWVMRKMQVGVFCPFCIDGRYGVKAATAKLVRRYFYRLGAFLLVGIPAFLGYVWTFTHVGGG